jgi:hypothetical protein
MNNNLSDKLNSLSPKERYCFFKRLNNVLNDRYSCFVYGGTNNNEYSSMPKEKIEEIKNNLYEEMFNHLIPPSKMIVEFVEFSSLKN